MSSTIDRPPTGEALSAALDEGLDSAVAAIPPWVMAIPEYPVQVTFDQNVSPNQFWAIPVLGFVAKSLALIPHLIALAVLGVAVLLAQLVLWISVLSTGRFPDWGETLVGGTIRWTVRVAAYLFGLTDVYPPFSLHDAEGDAPYPVRITVQRQPMYNQAWAIPFLGLLVKSVLLIPHFLILRVFEVVAGVLFLVSWIPVLFTGIYPMWGYQLVGGYLRWNTRVFAYLFGLTDRYPPFQMG